MKSRNPAGGSAPPGRWPGFNTRPWEAEYPQRILEQRSQSQDPFDEWFRQYILVIAYHQPGRGPKAPAFVRGIQKDMPCGRCTCPSTFRRVSLGPGLLPSSNWSRVFSLAGLPQLHIWRPVFALL